MNDKLDGYRDAYDPTRPNAVHDTESMNFAYERMALGHAVVNALYNQQDTVVRYLMRRAAEESAAAMLALRDADLSSPSGALRARSLQNDAVRYKEMVEWLEEAINHGTDAQNELEDAGFDVSGTDLLGGFGRTTDGDHENGGI